MTDESTVINAMVDAFNEAVWQGKKGDMPMKAAYRAALAVVHSNEGTEIERLKGGYAECLEDLISWSGYASDYFKDKHKLADNIARHKNALGVPHDK